MFPLPSSIYLPRRRDRACHSLSFLQLFLLSRQFTTTRPVLARWQAQKVRVPSRKAMAEKARRRAAKEARLVDHSEDMNLESAIAAIEVARPTASYELFVKTDVVRAGHGGGIAVPKGRMNMPREPKPRKEDTILVFADGRQAEEAKRAGAQIVGGTELIDEILSNWIKAQVILCTPSLIRAITPKLGRYLGPLGLIYRNGRIRMPLALMNFPIPDVVKNFRYIMDSIKRATGNIKKHGDDNSKKATPIMKVTLSSRNAPAIVISDY
ncbi:ribosomal protein L1 [Mycena rebaudengoi]|nr:ribosomal protein L1 [Mycena rebaudengoi]